MAQKFEAEGAPLADSPAPINPDATPDSIHPGLRPSLTEVPVTPGIHLGEYKGSQRSTGGSGYFSQNPGRHGMAQTPSQVAAGAKGPLEILRRLSLTHVPQQDASAKLPKIDPRVENPELELSGNVISATFTIPQSLQWRKGQDWSMQKRRGTSALFDSFTYLSSDETPWNHTLVGWTGEIQPAEELTPPDTPPGYRLPPLNKSSAPIPFEGYEKPEDPAHRSIFVSKEDQSRLEWQLAHDKSCKTVPVWLHDDEKSPDGREGITLKDQGRWRRFAEHDLYTLFHYKQNEPTNARAARKQYADYFLLNQKFATKILETYKPGDIVMIHDYHLLLLPGMLRQKVPNMYISFFLHIPFPSSEFMRCLPQRKQILEGVLHSDLIGFQSYGFSRHFSSCCTRILGFVSDSVGVEAYGQKVTVGVFPIGIDAAEVEKLAFNPTIDQKVADLRKLHGGKKIIVGRDRLDSVRGVPQKLLAYERFFEEYPEWRDRVVLIQVTSPTSVEEEKEDSGNKIASKVSELVSRINGNYGSLDHWPVQHYSQYLYQEEYMALLRVADLGLITSVRDGMNTTSLEYIVAQRDNHGPLILSEFSGTAGSLSDAIHINPWDLAGVATEINNALTMSEEKKEVAHHSLFKHVTTNNMQHWSDNYVKRLVKVLKNRTKVATPALSTVELIRTYQAARKRLFMFDYDGTLTPIVRDPHAAIPNERVIQTLTALASDPKNAVWIISGRDQEFLTKYLGHIEGLGFSAEHGSFMRQPGSVEWENLAETYDMGWQKPVLECFQKYTELTPGSFIERKRCALTWHYRPSDPELGANNARLCSTELESTVGKSWDVEVMAGKANLEVRPTFINKGEIAKKLVASYGADEPLEFSLCLGDDFTDEDMFRALNASGLPDQYIFTVVVGASSKPTLAKWHLLEPKDVISSVALLNGGDIDPNDLGALNVAAGHDAVKALGAGADAPHHTIGA